MKIECEIEEVILENEDGRKVPGIRATCSNCSHTTESFGVNDNSVKRCLALMREECPEDEENFYVAEDDY